MLSSVPMTGDSLIMSRNVASRSSIGAGDYLAGRFADTHHDIRGAALGLSVALGRNPGNVELQQRLMLCLAADGRLNESGRLASQIFDRDGNNLVAGLIVMEQQAKSGNWVNVEKIAKQLTGLSTGSAVTVLAESWAKVGQGKNDEALAVLKPLWGINLSILQTALINDMADHRDEAAASYEEMLAAPGGLSMVGAEAAIDFYWLTGNQAAAQKILERIRAANPFGDFGRDMGGENVRAVSSAADGLAYAFFITAMTVLGNGDIELPLVFFNMALDLRPDFPFVQLMMSEVLRGAGQTEEAMTRLETLRKTSPFYWSSRLLAAKILNEKNDIAGAVLVLDDIAQNSSKQFEALMMIGDIYSERKQWGKAIEAYDRAIAWINGNRASQSDGVSRRYWSAYFSRGAAHERSNKWSLAEADLRKAMALNPDSPEVLNYLGYGLVEHMEHLDQARQLLKKAFLLKPSDGNIVDSLGWAFYQSGMFPQAVEMLRKAVEIMPGDPIVNAHLGDALWRNGQQDEARFQWKHAIKSNPDDDLRKDLKKRLEAGLPPPQAKNHSSSRDLQSY